MKKNKKDCKLFKNIFLSNNNIDFNHPNYRKYVLVNLGYILSFIVYITFSIFHFYSNYSASVLEFIFSIASIFGFFKLRLDQNIEYSATFLTLLVSITVLIVTYFFEFQNGIMFWSLIIPTVAINLNSTRYGLFFALLFYLLIYIGGYYYSSIGAITYLEYYRFIAVSIVITSLIYFNEKSYTKLFEIQNKLNNILKKNSITDSLTNLFNRRHFDEIVKEEFNRAKRANKSFVLAIIDVDNFKAYNDTYGHDAGDDVLVKLGEILNKYTSRSGDYAFRIGGEEFAVILQSESYEDIYTHFEHLRLLIETEEITHTSNKPYDFLTVSTGVTLAKNSNSTTLKYIYNRSDKNLYYIKHNGRNGTKLTTL